jgi:hypothetical protein
MTEETQHPEKKLFVDEDWKSQVEAEREAARHAAEAAQPAETPSPAGPSPPLPPANLTFLVSTLYLQGAIALGLMPNPVTNKIDVRLEQAKHSIDLLAMLQQKTEGNRTPEESDEFDAALHQLRLAFVTVSEGGEATGATS